MMSSKGQYVWVHLVFIYYAFCTLYLTLLSPERNIVMGMYICMHAYNIPHIFRNFPSDVGDSRCFFFAVEK